jgi:hypothetical protein
VVNERTLVVTTVHESQIVDELSLDLMSEHDLPVDIIVTPKRIFNVRKRHNDGCVYSECLEAMNNALAISGMKLNSIFPTCFETF